MTWNGALLLLDRRIDFLRFGNLDLDGSDRFVNSKGILATFPGIFWGITLGSLSESLP